MKRRELVIQRPAEQMTRGDVANLVRSACGFQCEILFRSGDFQVNAKSLLGVIALQMEPGMELCVTAKGPDEDRAFSEICVWFSQTDG